MRIDKSKWLPEVREGYEAAEKAVKEYGWSKCYDTYTKARQAGAFSTDPSTGRYGAGFLHYLCDSDPNKGRARTFSGNSSRTPFGIR
jgi:hypothetical protein